MFQITIFLTLLAHLHTCGQCRKLHHPYLAICCHLPALCHLSFSKWPLLKGTVQPCLLQSTSTCTQAPPCHTENVTSLAWAVPCPRYTNRCEKTHLALLLHTTIISPVQPGVPCQGLLLNPLDVSQCPRPSHTQGCRVHPYTLQQWEDF